MLIFIQVDAKSGLMLIFVQEGARNGLMPIFVPVGDRSRLMPTSMTQKCFAVEMGLMRAI